MKFLKTIRFDPSDTHVFEQAAEQNEWAISGGFWFSGITQEQLKGKTKQAFSNGFLSIETFGFSTFASVSEITQSEIDQLTKQFSEKLFSDFGAPSLQEADTASREEIHDILEMCEDVPINSVFALKRILDEKNEIRESFNLVEQSAGDVHTRIWEIVE